MTFVTEQAFAEQVFAWDKKAQTVSRYEQAFAWDTQRQTVSLTCNLSWTRPRLGLLPPPSLWGYEPRTEKSGRGATGATLRLRRQRRCRLRKDLTSARLCV